MPLANSKKEENFKVSRRLLHLHQVRPRDVGDGSVDDPDRVRVDHGRADEEVKDDVDANGVDVARLGMAGRHQKPATQVSTLGQWWWLSW